MANTTLSTHQLVGGLTTVAVAGALLSAPTAKADGAEYYNAAAKAVVCLMPAVAMERFGKYIAEEVLAFGESLIPAAAKAATGAVCDVNFDKMAKNEPGIFDIQTHTGHTVNRTVGLSQLTGTLPPAPTTWNQSTNPRMSHPGGPSGDCSGWGTILREMCINGEIYPIYH